MKDEVAAYWTARATSYDGSVGHGIGSMAERAAWLGLVQDGVGDLRGRRVLELASGTGEFTGVLLDAGADVTGLDLSEGMLARARAKLSGRAVRLYPGDAEDTREAAGGYDAVVCRHLVWTLADPCRALTDWFRVLRPGGRLLIVDGDWVRRPWHGVVRHAAGRLVGRLLGHPPDPVDWAAHERIMAQVHFRAGLVRAAGFRQTRTGSLRAVRRVQMRAIGWPTALLVGGYTEFWLSAVKD